MSTKRAVRIIKAQRTPGSGASADADTGTGLPVSKPHSKAMDNGKTGKTSLTSRTVTIGRSRSSSNGSRNTSGGGRSSKRAATMMKRQNRCNKLPTVDDIESMMRSNGLHLRVNDITVYHTAFIHRSYLKNNSEEHDPLCVPLQDVCNETYEFLGDTILNSIIGTYLYDRYRDQNEGFLTKTRTKLVRGSTLGELAKRLGLNKWIVISQHVEEEGGRNNLRILEDLFESFIAAIYLDNGSQPLDNGWFTARDEVEDILEALEALGSGGTGSRQQIDKHTFQWISILPEVRDGNI